MLFLFALLTDGALPRWRSPEAGKKHKVGSARGVAPKTQIRAPFQNLSPRLLLWGSRVKKGAEYLLEKQNCPERNVMKKFVLTLGRVLWETIAFVVMVVRNPGPSLAVATLATGVLSYVVTGGRPWNSAVFVYTALAWLCWIVIRWGYFQMEKSSSGK
ncbi:MAG: hypothetical protein Q8P52_00030 [bacterium]|nr:hypothetical protein [bacterium]